MQLATRPPHPDEQGCRRAECEFPPLLLLQRLLEKTPTISRKQRRSLHAYYLRQNELIDALLQTEQIHRGLFTNDAHKVGSGSSVLSAPWVARPRQLHTVHGMLATAG